GRMKWLFTQCVENFIVVKFDALRFAFSTINNGRYTAGATQAAARTRSLNATRGGFKFHGELQINNTVYGIFKKAEPVGSATRPAAATSNGSNSYSTNSELTDSAWEIRRMVSPSNDALESWRMRVQSA